MQFGLALVTCKVYTHFNGQVKIFSVVLAVLGIHVPVIARDYISGRFMHYISSTFMISCFWFVLRDIKQSIKRFC